LENYASLLPARLQIELVDDLYKKVVEGGKGKKHVNPDIIREVLSQVKLTGGNLSMEISKT